MNAPEKSAFLPYIQSEVDGRDLCIVAVGINPVRYPMIIRADKRLPPTVATLSMTVGLPAVTKGSHIVVICERFLQQQLVESGPVRTVIERRPSWHA